MSLIERYFETDKDFYKKLVFVALPVVLQSLITTGVNMIDTIMLGQLTESVLSASSLANQFIGLFMFAIMGISMGSSVLVSRFFGAKDKVALKKSITIAIRFVLGLSTIFTIVNICFPVQIMSLYITDPVVIEQGAIYLRWSTITYLLVGMTTITTNVMRSTNLNQYPLYASMAAFMINIGANYIFIFGKFGAPAMGIAGAALGTVIARVVETGILVYIFYIKDKTVGYRIKDILTPCNELVQEFVKISVPVMLSDSLLGVGDNVLAIIMGHIGSNFVSANAITMVVQRVSTIFITGLAFSSCFIIGQTLGEGKVDSAKKQGFTFLILGFVTGVVAAGIIELISNPVINSYNITQETVEIAHELMNAVSVIIIFRATNSILTKGVLRAGGDTRFLLLADISTMWLLAIPMGAVSGLVLKLNAFIVYMCLHFDQIVKAIWCIFRFKSNKWIVKVKGVR